MDGKQENFVQQKVFPAISIDGSTVTEPDLIIENLEKSFGPLNGSKMGDEDVKEAKKLEK